MASLREFHRCLEQDAPELEAGNTQPISISSAFTVLTWPLLERRLDQWPWSRRPLPHDNSRVRQCTLNPQSQAQGWHPEQVDIGIFIFISVIEDHLKAWDLRCVQPCVGLASNCQPQGEASSQEWERTWAAGLWDSPCSPQESQPVSSGSQVSALAEEPHAGGQGAVARGCPHCIGPKAVPPR